MFRLPDLFIIEKMTGILINDQTKGVKDWLIG